jgi:hypothetical protein
VTVENDGGLGARLQLGKCIRVLELGGGGPGENNGSAGDDEPRDRRE